MGTLQLKMKNRSAFFRTTDNKNCSASRPVFPGVFAESVSCRFVRLRRIGLKLSIGPPAGGLILPDLHWRGSLGLGHEAGRVRADQGDPDHRLTLLVVGGQ